MCGGINEINRAAPASESATADASTGLIGFLFAARGGDDLEKLIVQDTAQQRKVASAIRTARREQQMRAALDAAAKLKEAANKQMWSAAISAGINLVVSIGQAFIPETTIGKIANGACESTKQFFSNYVPFLTEEIAELQADAGVLQTQSDIYAQQAKDQSDWLQSARELEQKMISHLEKQIELDNRRQNI